MTVETDPALYSSNFKRNAGDRYYTEPWVTEAFLRTWGNQLDSYRDLSVWEPACGAGDMVYALENRGYDLVATDIDLSDYGHYHPIYAISFDNFDFLNDGIPIKCFGDEPVAIITNPPYKLAEEFIRQALAYMNSDDGPDVRLVAMLLRSEYHHAKRRRDLFTPEVGFAGETILTSRPRWDDWWNGKPPKAAPRHNFSWFIWQKTTMNPDPIIKFAGKST